MATRKAKKASTKKIDKKKGAPPAFLLSKSMLGKLPSTERAIASADLWAKSAGLCALCSLPLDLSQKDSIVPDHKVPEAKGGATSVGNLYLAHRICNASRQHLDFEVARPLAKFRSLADHNRNLDFDIVVNKFVEGPSRQLVGFSKQPPGSVEIKFGHTAVRAPLSVDPATNVEYFFVDVPVSFIFNDVDIQPRAIMPAHVRKLALDFLERPVHEPSNCRLVVEAETQTARLLQFDGQHKTTAQILIGRERVPMKIYIAPPIDMLQSLVIKIQQEIKKQPLTRSETLAKIGDVIERMLEGYVEKKGKARTEKGLIAQQPHAERSVAKKLYLDELKRIVFFDDQNLLSKAVGPGVANAPTTDKVVINKIITPLLFSQLLEEDLDSGLGRDEERKNVLMILNALAEQMLPKGWDAPGNKIARLRAENFFYQGSIGWWMTEILVPSLRYVLYALGNDKPLLVKQLGESDKEKIQTLVEALCNWSLWSTDDTDHLKAMRSNTVRNMVEAFPDYSDKRLLESVD